MFTIKIISDNGNVKLEKVESLSIFKKGTEEFTEYELNDIAIEGCKAYLFEFESESMSENFGCDSEVTYKKCIAIFENEKCYITDSHGNTVEVVG